MTQLILTPIQGIPIISPGDDLAEIIINTLELTGITLKDGDIIVLAQKIVSKAEGRFVNLTQVVPGSEALRLSEITEKDPRLLELILRECNCVLRMRKDLIIVEHKKGFICANAGIDHSNVQPLWGNPEDWVLLLPEDADYSASEIRDRLEKRYSVRIGVVIIDSHGRAWRLGTVGVTIGVSGVPGVLDLRGQEDLFGYKLRATFVAVADELAAAASLLMGQANEASPVVLVRGFPYELSESGINDLIRPVEFDLFR